jgi:hypothetical protein
MTDGTPNVAQSVAQAAVLWGIDKGEVLRAKHAGCIAFRGSRVHRDRLIDWLEKNPPEASDDDSEEGLKKEKLKVQIELLKNNLAVEKEAVIPRSTVTAEWGKLIADIFDIIEKSTDRVTYNAIAKELKNRLGHRTAR